MEISQEDQSLSPQVPAEAGCDGRGSISQLNRSAPLPGAFYARDVRDVARELLGKVLVRRTRQGVTAGKIVETEAYLPQSDSACHATAGPNLKTAAMFGPPGTAYVYVIHARHCFNVVAEADGVGCAALIRAVVPLLGVRLMQSRRGKESLLELARGPARLCEAMDIDRAWNGWDLTRGRSLFIIEGGESPAGTDESPARPGRDRIRVTPRIGVTSARDLPLRYVLADNPYVSGPKRLR